MTGKKMMRISVAGAALLFGAALSSGGALAASAQATAAGDDDVARYVVPQAKAAGDYWTSERMQDAIPADTLVADNVAAQGAASATAADAPREVAAEPAASEAPVSHIGKVFFTLGGVDYVCSGNSIASANGSTVATAGHCVNEGPGEFASRWTFVPAYENGNAPYGEWSATELFAPTQWAEGGDISYDTGFAVVSGPGGTLSDAVGASGVAFNQSRGASYTAYGYPAASPFDGETLKSCRGSASDDPFGQSDSQGLPCDMTGGSSGGPWFLGGGSGGSQNSINSFGYDGVANTMFGPYWGSVIESAYDQAAA